MSCCTPTWYIPLYCVANTQSPKMFDSLLYVMSIACNYYWTCHHDYDHKAMHAKLCAKIHHQVSLSLWMPTQVSNNYCVLLAAKRYIILAIWDLNGHQAFCECTMHLINSAPMKNMKICSYDYNYWQKFPQPLDCCIELTCKQSSHTVNKLLWDYFKNY